MASQPGAGGAVSSFWVGPTAELLPKLRWRSFLQTGLLSYWRGAFLILGLLALVVAVWLRWGPQQRNASIDDARPFVLFFCMALGQALGALQFLADGSALDLDFYWLQWLAMAGMLGVMVCALHFLCLVQQRPRPRLGRVLMLYSIAVAVVALPLWWPAPTVVMPLLRLLLLPSVLILVGVAVAGAWQLRSRSSILLSLWALLSIPVYWHDMAMHAHRLDLEGIYLSPYANLSLLLLFLLIAFTRYTKALDTAAAARVTLTERLDVQERELLHTHERLRLVEREQTLLQERQRLMREMHDGVGSSLMSALRLVEHDSKGTDVAQVLRECIDDLKIAIDSLEPVDADLLALLGALRFRLGRRLSGAGISLQWHMHDLPPLPWLDAQNGLHVLRILQEVLTNIVKHADATNIVVCAEPLSSPQEPGVPGVCVRVRDNGKPFIPPALETLQAGRRGLANVHTRIHALKAHGDWHCDSHGTHFTLWLPLVR